MADRLSPSDITALTALEEGMWRPETRYDAQFQQTHFTADFFEFGRSGRVYAREDSVRDSGIAFDAQLPLDGLLIRELAPGLAQLTYRSHCRYPGEPVEHANRCSLWSRTPAGWVMRFHQGTPYTSPTTEA